MRILNKLKDKLLRNEEIKIKAGIYTALLADKRYEDVLADLFKKKLKEKEDAIYSLSGNNAEEIGMRFVELRAERNVYNMILNAPEKFIKATEKIKIEEENKKKSQLNTGERFPP